MSKDIYESPLSSRYASQYMLHLFSPDMRFQTWRRLWVELARAEHDLGLPITAEQVAELEAHVTDIDYAAAEQREREVRHDVMAHVLRLRTGGALGGRHHPSGCHQLLCDGQRRPDSLPGRPAVSPEPAPVACMLNLSVFARQYAATPTLGYTHYQPAQPVTVGKRAALWLQDLPLRSGGTGSSAGYPVLPGLPGHHRHGGQLPGPF